jgi:hypothetical protein
MFSTTAVDELARFSGSGGRDNMNSFTHSAAKHLEPASLPATPARQGCVLSDAL